jgi:hypothetical protein
MPRAGASRTCQGRASGEQSERSLEASGTLPDNQSTEAISRTAEDEEGDEDSRRTGPPLMISQCFAPAALREIQAKYQHHVRQTESIVWVEQAAAAADDRAAVFAAHES